LKAAIEAEVKSVSFFVMFFVLFVKVFAGGGMRFERWNGKETFKHGH